MPQPSISYACGRVGVLRQSALSAAQLDRLMATHTYEDARRALSDIGFTSSEGMDFQAAADQHVKNACELLEAITPMPEVTGCFMLRYDVHNLKVLLKARFLAQKPQFLSSCGTIKVETLRHAVTERRYGMLPQALKDALNALEKQLAKQFDPMLIDVELDKAMYTLIFERLKGFKGHGVVQYFTAKADLQNYIMLLRSKAMGKDAAFFQKLFLPGGSIPFMRMHNAFDDQTRLAGLIRPYGETLYRVALECAMDAAHLPFMEKQMDDYLYKLFSGAKYQMNTVDALIAYLLRVQREATDVRLIMTGKLNGFTAEELAERVRELNG